MSSADFLRAGDKQPSAPATESGLHSIQRTKSHFLAIALLGALFVAGLSLPAVSNRVGVSVRQGAFAVAALLVVMLPCHFAYHRLGVTSKLYRFLDYVETLTLSGAIAFLIHCAGTGLTFFWSFHLGQVFIMSQAGLSARNAGAISIGPAALAVSFATRGDEVSAWLSGMSCLLGLYLYVSLARLYSEREAAQAREAELRAELARVLVERERTRISRDLHDNVATELTALVWKAREIAATAPHGESKAEISAISERLRSVINDLRSVVLSLRGPTPGFEEARELLERRCRELCANKQLVFLVNGDLELSELAAWHEAVLPICFELVRNAAVHSAATRIQLSIVCAADVRLEVVDDGIGMSPRSLRESNGGLHSVRERIRRLGGSLDARASGSGTRLHAIVPRPLQLDAP
jgi:signal transduction histidine kinase